MALTGTVAVDGQSIRMSGSGVIDLKGNRAHLTMAAGPVKIEEISQGLVIYLRDPAISAKLRQALHTNKSWLKIDIAKAGKQSGLDLAQLQGGQDPSQQLSYLRGVSGKVEKVGSESVRGVATTHYHAVVDLRRYPSTVPRARRAAARATVAKLIALAGETTEPVDVWIDAQHRVRRMRFAQTIKSGGVSAKTDMTMDTYDFGTPVRIQPPPGSDTNDFTGEAVKALKQAGG